MWFTQAILSSDWLTMTILSSDWLVVIIMQYDWLTMTILVSDWLVVAGTREGGSAAGLRGTTRWTGPGPPPTSPSTARPRTSGARSRDPAWSPSR